MRELRRSFLLFAMVLLIPLAAPDAPAHAPEGLAPALLSLPADPDPATAGTSDSIDAGAEHWLPLTLASS